MEFREYKGEETYGIDFSSIEHGLVNFDGFEAEEGDLFVQKDSLKLKNCGMIFYEEGFKLNTNNPNHYLTFQDLHSGWLNVDLIWRKRISDEK